jgi:hypothetical protein
MKLTLTLTTLFVAGTNGFTIDASRAADQCTPNDRCRHPPTGANMNGYIAATGLEPVTRGL